MSIYQVLGLLLCTNQDLKATVKTLKEAGVITEDEYAYIAGKIESRLT